MASYLQPLRTFRDTLAAMVPAWLNGPLGVRWLYAHSIQIDAFADALISGVQTRFPGFYSDESLPLIGRERRILRGLNEPDANYAARLTTWLSDHAIRGSARAMLNQLYLHYYPDNFPMQLVSRNGVSYAMDATGTITRSVVPWVADATPERWARWWLLLPTDRWGTSPTADEIADITAIPRAWNAAHAQGTIIVLPTGAELWASPAPETWASPAPATWASTIGPIYINVNE